LPAGAIRLSQALHQGFGDVHVRLQPQSPAQVGMSKPLKRTQRDSALVSMRTLLRAEELSREIWAGACGGAQVSDKDVLWILPGFCRYSTILSVRGQRLYRTGAIPFWGKFGENRLPGFLAILPHGAVLLGRASSNAVAAQETPEVLPVPKPK